MKVLLIAIGFFTPVFASATSIADYQSKCEKQFGKFPAMAACLSSSIKSDDDYANDLDAQLYAAQANSLAAKVNRKAMYEEDAVLELQEKYIVMNDKYRKSLERKDDSFMSVIKDGMRKAPAVQQQNTIVAPQQQQKNCTPAGGPINYQCIYGQ